MGKQRSKNIKPEDEVQDRGFIRSPIKVLCFILVLVFYGSLLLHKIDLPAADDLPRHIKNGDMIVHGNFDVLYSNFYSYTEPGYSFVNHHWLSGVVFYVLYESFGWNGLVIFKVLVLLAAFVFFFLTATRKAPFWLVLPLSLVTIFILSERTDVRPEIFSYFFVGVYLYILTCFEEHPEKNTIFWLIPLQILWVNLHIFFFISIMLIGGFLLEKIIVHRKKLRKNIIVEKLFITLLLVTAVSVINPNGIGGVLAPVYILNTGAQVTENQPLGSFLKVIPLHGDISATIFTPTVFLLAVSFFFGLKRKPIFYFLSAIGTAIAGFLMIRMMPFLGIIFLPAASANFSHVFYATRVWLLKKIPQRMFVLESFLILLIIVTFSTLIFVGSRGKFLPYKNPGLGIAPHSMDAASFFISHGLKGPILNDFASGSYLAYSLYPQGKVFVDNRPEAYSVSFFRDIYFPITEDENAWRVLSQKYDFNVIFMYQYAKAPKIRSFLYARIRDPDWALVYVGTHHFIFLRNIPQNQKIISQFHITQNNVGEKLAYLVNSENYDDQVAAADIFSLIGREDLCTAQYLQVVSLWPESPRVWMAMGRQKLRSTVNAEDSALAVTYIEKAISSGQKTAEAYYYLAKGYQGLGRITEAKEALNQALKLNPEYQNAQDLSGQLQENKDTKQ